MSRASWDYEELKRLVADEPLPAMLVDLRILEANVRRIRQVVEGAGKRLRVASKSVRCVDLLRRILDWGGPAFRGLMCYSVAEAEHLARHGFEDLMVAYPAIHGTDLEIAARLYRSGRVVTLMIDSPEHVERLANLWQDLGHDLPPLDVAIDVDVSYRPLRGIHLGVQRSPIRSAESFRATVRAMKERSNLRLAGVMAYEAQIAGLPDANPFEPLLNPAKRLIKARSRRDVAKRRQELAQILASEGVTLDFFNGGGTGSLATSTQESWLTEVTAGSGFLQSHLFDYYQGNANEPAFCFALRVTRIPEPGVVTCQSGGFIASGATSPDKAPRPFLPVGLEIFSTEGFGEVQTPFRVPSDVRLGLGDPVFCRSAKAGEIAERFREYLLFDGRSIVARVPTYRGEGKAFY